jgi:hypothetical protein
MRHLKSYKLFESSITKNELVDKIKYLSHYLHTYVKDVNKFTTNNLNLRFSYDTVLDMIRIFEVADLLDYDSTDGFITAVAQQFIIWSEYFTESKWHGKRFKEELESFKFDDNYLNYTDDFKQEHKWVLYKQEYNHFLYGYVGQTIKQLISGTIWDITEKKDFTDEDKQFILDCLYSDYDVDDNYIKRASDLIDVSKTSSDNEKGYIIRIPIIGDIWKNPVSLGTKSDYNTDFINRLQSYFGAVFILEGKWREYYKLCLPFYK